jgi:hypothetical protein
LTKDSWQIFYAENDSLLHVDNEKNTTHEITTFSLLSPGKDPRQQCKTPLPPIMKFLAVIPSITKQKTIVAHRRPSSRIMFSTQLLTSHFFDDIVGPFHEGFKSIVTNYATKTENQIGVKS